MQTDADRITQSRQTPRPLWQSDPAGAQLQRSATLQLRRLGPSLRRLRRLICRSEVRRRIHEPHAGRFSRFLAKDRVSRFNWIAMIGIPLAAILFQVYVPRFITYLSYLELPLLVTVYFSLMRRSPVAGVFFGAGIGLAQDSFRVPPPAGDVRHREDAGGLFCRVA